LPTDPVPDLSLGQALREAAGDDAAMAAAAQLLTALPAAVLVCRATPRLEVLGLNRAAATGAGIDATEAVGRSVFDLYPELPPDEIAALVEKAIAGIAPVSARAFTIRNGERINIEAVPITGPDRTVTHLLVVAQPVDPAAAMRDQLETLLETTEAMWQSTDFESMAAATMEQVSRLLPGIDCALGVVPRDRQDRIVVIAANASWIPVGFDSPLADTFAQQSISAGHAIETTDAPADSSAAPILQAAGVGTSRSVPLLARQRLPDGRTAIGAINFMRRGQAPFSTDQRRLMDEFGKRVALAAERLFLLMATRASERQLQAALASAVDLSSSLAPREVVQRLLLRAVETMGADRATLSRVEGEEIVIEATYDVIAKWDWPGLRFPIALLAAQPLLARAMETGEPAIGGRLDVAAAEPEFQSALDEVQHTLSLPLLLEGRPFALLLVSRRTNRYFDQEDVARIKLMASGAALALHNATLYSEAEAARKVAAESAERLQLGVDLALDLAERLDLGAVVPVLLKRATEVSHSDRCTLCTIEGEEVLIEHSYCLEGPAPEPGTRIRVDDQPILEEALAGRRPVQTESLDYEAADRSGQPYLRQLGRFAIVPLVFGGDIVGTLNLSRIRADEYTQDELQTLQLIGQIAVLAVRNARLFSDLAEASQSKSDFLNLAAHELRTPISVINGYLSMLEDGTFGVPPEPWSRPLEIIRDKSTELGRLVDSLLGAAKLQSGSLETKPVLVDVGSRVREAIERVQPRADMAGADVAVELPAEPLEAEVDPDHLARILDNLLNNAITYTRQAAWLRVRVRAMDRQVAIEVEDHGIGIPAAKQAAVFEQFIRLEGSGIGLPPGTGLGLYIARKMAELAGGSLRLTRSEPGRGSLFTLLLPRSN